LSKPRLPADENIPRTAITTLRERGYDVASVYELRPGMSDEEVIELAVREQRVIMTFDKDFGRTALSRPGIPGVILLRIPPLSPLYIVERILSALERIGDPRNKLIIVRRNTIKIVTLSAPS